MAKKLKIQTNTLQQLLEQTQTALDRVHHAYEEGSYGHVSDALILVEHSAALARSYANSYEQYGTHN